MGIDKETGAKDVLCRSQNAEIHGKSEVTRREI